MTIEHDPITPERPGSPWRTSTPWKALDARHANCDYHGPFTAVLWKAVVPPAWEAKQAKKKNSLKAAGLDSFVKDFWGKCPKCDDAIHAEQLASYTEAMEGSELRKSLLALKAAEAGIDAVWADAEPFHNMKAFHPPMRAALQDIRGYCQDLDLVRQTGRCMVLLGPKGVGKTHALCAILNYAMSRGRTARYSSLTDMISVIADTYGHRDGETESKALARYIDVDFLAIDEVGRDSMNDLTKRKLFQIIDSRYRKCRPTIIASNLAIKELGSCVGEATVDRFREAGGKTVKMIWESLRGREDLK